MATTVGYRYVAAKCSPPIRCFFPIPEQKNDDLPYETRIPHQINFIESVRSRIDPTVPVEIGHSSCTVCNLGNIAYKLGRPVKWNTHRREIHGRPGRNRTAALHLPRRLFAGRLISERLRRTADTAAGIHSLRRLPQSHPEKPILCKQEAFNKCLLLFLHSSIT